MIGPTWPSVPALFAILEKLYDQNPQHPGVTHFLIHAYDYHPLAEKGVPAARRYAGIAPAVPHARHMPSHIYSMVGLWEESIASNAAAIVSTLCDRTRGLGRRRGAPIHVQPVPPAGLAHSFHSRSRHGAYRLGRTLMTAPGTIAPVPSDARLGST